MKNTAINTKPSIKKEIVKKQSNLKSDATHVIDKSKEKFVPHSTSLKIGIKAPLFSGIDHNGEEIKLTDYKGKKVVLYFYPKDSTPGCTAQACSLRDEYKFLTKQNYVVIGVSADDIKSHKKFATKLDLPFVLLADTEKTIIKAYDVWGLKQFMGRIFEGIVRTTFIIDEKGKIEEIIKDVNTKLHAQQIIA